MNLLLFMHIEFEMMTDYAGGSHRNIENRLPWPWGLSRKVWGESHLCGSHPGCISRIYRSLHFPQCGV